MKRHFEREGIIWKCDRSTNEKFLLFAMNSFVDGNGECFPGQETLARMTGMSLRTVVRCIASLTSDGIIKKSIRRKNGVKTSNQYFVDFDALSVTVSHDRESHDSESDDRVADGYVTESPKLSVTVAHELSSELSSNELSSKEERSEAEPSFFDQGEISQSEPANSLHGEPQAKTLDEAPGDQEAPLQEVVNTALDQSSAAPQNRSQNDYEQSGYASSVQKCEERFRQFAKLSPWQIPDAQGLWEGKKIDKDFSEWFAKHYLSSTPYYAEKLKKAATVGDAMGYIRKAHLRDSEERFITVQTQWGNYQDWLIKKAQADRQTASIVPSSVPGYASIVPTEKAKKTFSSLGRKLGVKRNAS